jgi:hypothetical protein
VPLLWRKRDPNRIGEAVFTPIDELFQRENWTLAPTEMKPVVCAFLLAFRTQEGDVSTNHMQGRFPSNGDRGDDGGCRR